jgi:hypothetical protein
MRPAKRCALGGPRGNGENPVALLGESIYQAPCVSRHLRNSGNDLKGALGDMKLKPVAIDSEGF